jgi:hypothetical protein
MGERLKEWNCVVIGHHDDAGSARYGNNLSAGYGNDTNSVLRCLNEIMDLVFLIPSCLAMTFFKKS